MTFSMRTGWLAAAIVVVLTAVLILGPSFGGPDDARAQFKCPKPSTMASISDKTRAARPVKRKIGSDYQVKKVKRLRQVSRWRKLITRECGRKVTARTVYVFADYKVAQCASCDAEALVLRRKGRPLKKALRVWAFL